MTLAVPVALPMPLSVSVYVLMPVLAAVLVALAVLVWPTAEPRQGGGAVGTSAGRAGSPQRVRSGLHGPRRRREAGARLREQVARALRSRGPGGRVGAVEEVQLLDGLAAALEAGLPTAQAVHVALEPVLTADQEAGPWSELARSAREGQPLDPAWQRLARRTGSLTAASVARAWSVAAVTGAPVAAAVRSSAHAARERHRLERAVEVATAGARATARVLGLLPLAGVGLAALLGIHPLSLYSHPFALASAGLGAVLLGAGHLTVRRMVAGVLRGVS